MNSLSGALKRKQRYGDRHTGRRACEDRGPDWSDGTTSQRMPTVASNHQKLEEKHGRFLFPASEGTSSADTLIPDVQMLEL